MRSATAFRGRGAIYGKIFDSIYDGTLYGHWEAIVTMQQLVVLADADGIVDMTPQAIVARTSIPMSILEIGLKKLSEPDPFSRTPGEDGRRIVCIDEHRPWGWQLVNYMKYKHLKDANEVRAQTRERVQRFREKRNGEKRDVTPVTLGNAEKRYTDTDTDTEKRATRSQGSRLPPEWFPSEKLTVWASEARPDLDLPAVVEKFKDHWRSVPGSRGTKLDWEATFRNWVRGEKPGNRQAPYAGEVI